MFGAFCDRWEKAGPTVFQFLASLHSTEHKRGEYVFMTASGTLYEPSNIRARVFHQCAEANGLPSFSFRSFRRTAATFIHNSGAPLKVQREIMGHADEEMSLVYSEAEVGLQRKTLEALDEQMFGDPSLPGVLKSLGMVDCSGPTA